MMDDNFDGEVSRFLEIAKRLKIAGVPYFTRTVTRFQMEIPALFVRDHGENMKPKARLRIGSGTKEWLLQIQVSYSETFRVRFCFRWRRFLSDNDLREGDELIVSLVAKSEFVIYMLKKNLDPRKLSRYSLYTNTTSPSRGDFRPDANTPKSKLRTSPLVRVEMQEGNFSENFRARPVALDTNKFRKQMAATETHVEIPENSFNGAIFFKNECRNQEIPAHFVRRHGRLLGDNTVITLDGPMPGTSSQVVCSNGPTNLRIMWRRGWHNFVTRNNLRKGDNLDFNLTAPSRFSVHLRNRSTQDPSLTIRNVNDSRNKKGSPAQGGKTSNALPVNCTNQGTAVDLHKNLHFIKTLPATSVSNCTAYPFLEVPTSFWHTVRLPPEVNLQGPNSDEIFQVKCPGAVTVGATKNLTCGWRDYANTNALKVGDSLRFTYVRESKLFVVDYV